ncbi:hypothetical protein ACSSTO_02995 [Bacillus atrophaeus]|uniref:hypothetical protein n=1 Tax=Bacillus atrophaeus TaxID=1452 RepID=UPI003EDA5077
MYSPINIKRSSNVNDIVTEPLNELEIKLTETFAKGRVIPLNQGHFTPNEG